ncbi:DNA polymerase Y family protein [Solimicrobium silvestre]|uniref:DNA polymerase IV n=1 Tax=Solimicrobium silvestre TaxID=2099400 RepID=A0A2S9H2G4_9BURK|nr:DNA polymerase IV [Solimicrobium silvestre]PRC94172.1 Nucleotidyltransferase/DNA polymerase involved in DNA repair [Solimicrobium silvestre]
METSLINRRIAHLDMDAFYASVELISYPELRGKPVAIGGRNEHRPILLADGTRQFSRLADYVGRGVLTTSTYEARALGVFSGMGTMKAAKLAPEAILLPVNFDAYRHYSRLFKAAVASVVSQIEDRGIDEIYLDLSNEVGETVELAQRIKNAVFEATGLSCSIGIAPNKLLAKICSDLEKPNGLTVLSMSDIPTRIWPLHVRKINGIGPKAAQKLEALGVNTIAQLAEMDTSILQEEFGRTYAIWLNEVAHGIDRREVITESETKSISRETTFERDLHARHDRAVLSEIFTSLCSKLAEDLQRKGYLSRTIGIKLRYDDFKSVTRDLTLPEPTADSLLIRQAAGACLKRVPLEKRLRLLGVKASGLVGVDEVPAGGLAVGRQLELDI